MKMERMFRETADGDFDTVTALDGSGVLVVGEIGVIHST